MIVKPRRGEGFGAIDSGCFSQHLAPLGVFCFCFLSLWQPYITVCFLAHRVKVLQHFAAIDTWPPLGAGGGAWERRPP